MAWPGLRECTAYLSLGQNSLPLGVRWFSDGLGGAGGRGLEKRVLAVNATGLVAEKGRRESARPTACGRAAERENGCWVPGREQNRGGADKNLDWLNSDPQTSSMLGGAEEAE